MAKRKKSIDLQRMWIEMAVLVLLAVFLTVMIGSTIAGWRDQGEENQAKTPQGTSTASTDTTPEQTPPPSTTEPGTEPQEPLDPAAFFSDAAFIGDSVSLMLRNQASSTTDLGSPIFLVKGSYSVEHAVSGSMLLAFQGQEMSPQDALAAAGVSKVFIMLGMNDIGAYGVDNTIEKWETFIDNIREKCPDIDIYIQSCTPIWTDGQLTKLNNENMDRYNRLLKDFAESHDCHFIDLAPEFKDDTGGLAAEYCSDEYVHLTQAGAQLWIRLLREHFGFDAA